MSNSALKKWRKGFTLNLEKKPSFLLGKDATVIAMVTSVASKLEEIKVLPFCDYFMLMFI